MIFWPIVVLVSRDTQGEKGSMILQRGALTRLTLTLAVLAGIVIGLIYSGVKVPQMDDQETNIEVVQFPDDELGEPSNSAREKLSLVTESSAEKSIYIPFDGDSVYTNMFTREYSVSSIRQTFDENILLANEGDARSMSAIADIVRSCRSVGSIKSSEEFLTTDWVQSGQTPEIFITSLLPLIEDCSYVNKHKPDVFSSYLTWSLDWYDRAADTGDVIAQLHVLERDEPSVENYEKHSALLTKAVQSGDYRAYYRAAFFFGKYGKEDDTRGVAVATWQYLACVHHQQCNESGYLNVAAEIRQFYPWEVKSIQSNIVRIQNQIENGKPIRFSSMLSLEEMLDGGESNQ